MCSTSLPLFLMTSPGQPYESLLLRVADTPQQYFLSGKQDHHGSRSTRRTRRRHPGRTRSYPSSRDGKAVLTLGRKRGAPGADFCHFGEVYLRQRSSSKRQLEPRWRKPTSGSYLLRPLLSHAPSLLPWCSLVLPRCSPVLAHCSLAAPLCSLCAPFKAAVRLFPSLKDDSQSSVRSVYNAYIYI